MNESTFTRAVNKRLTGADASVVAWKISDRFNAGRPDCEYIKHSTLYAEYKLEKVTKLPTRHTPALSELQKRELRRLYAVQPQNVRVFVAFIAGRVSTIAEYTTPAEWENSTPLDRLQLHEGQQRLVDRILFLISI